MSHTLRSKDLRIDRQAAQLAAAYLKLPAQAQARHRFYDGTVAEGTLVSLPGWQRPIVIQENGEVIYDNMQGHWGNILELEKFVGYTLAQMAEEPLESLIVEKTPEGLKLYNTVGG